MIVKQKIFVRKREEEQQRLVGVDCVDLVDCSHPTNVDGVPGLIKRSSDEVASGW